MNAADLDSLIRERLHGNGSRELRLILADAYADAGREDEATLLRGDVPVMIVRPEGEGPFDYSQYLVLPAVVPVEWYDRHDEHGDVAWDAELHHGRLTCKSGVVVVVENDRTLNAADLTPAQLGIGYRYTGVAPELIAMAKDAGFTFLSPL